MQRLLGWIVLLVIVFPLPSLALTPAELEAQIRALSEQLATLTAQIGQTAQTPTQTWQQSASRCPQLFRNLSRGDRGADVTSLQQFLVSEYVLGSDAATGFFGPLTENAVRAWQTRSDVVSSGAAATTGYGAVGPKTREKIAQVCIDEHRPLVSIDLTPPSQTSAPAVPTTPAVTTQTITPAPPPRELTLSEKVANWSCPSPIVASNTNYRLYSYTASKSVLYLENVDEYTFSQVIPAPPPPYQNALPQGGQRVLTSSMSDDEVRAQITYANTLLNQYWTTAFAALGRTYVQPTINVTADPSLAGEINYMPSTRTINLNTYYFNTQVPTQAFRDAGKSYIYQTLAHETGHHIQFELGLGGSIYEAQQAAGTQAKANAINACKEIQADFFAGVSLRGANLLSAGEPDYVYYGSASDANDTNMARGGYSLNSAEYTHGTAKQMSGAIYEGMQRGDLNRAINLLSGIGAVLQ